MPNAVAVDRRGTLYITSSLNEAVWTLDRSGVRKKLAGSNSSGDADGSAADARFHGPMGVAVDSAGNAFVCDVFNSKVRKVTPAGVVTTIASLTSPRAVAIYGGSLFVAAYHSSRVSADGQITPMAGGMNASTIAMDSAGNAYLANDSAIFKQSPSGEVTPFAGTKGHWGNADGTGTSARFAEVSGLAVCPDGSLYAADAWSSTIRKITPAGVVTTFAGRAGSDGYADGTGAAARFHSPQGIACDGQGNLFVADSLNGTIRKITPAGVVTTVAAR